jgi:hypothetical protein
LGHRTFKVRANDWDPIRAEHYGSGFTAAQTGRTHDRTRPMLQKRQKVLAKAAPSTHDPKETSQQDQSAKRP